MIASITYKATIPDCGSYILKPGYYTDSEPDSENSKYSSLDDRREKIRRNRSKTPSQQNWEKITGKISIRSEIPKKTSKIKVDIPKNVNDDTKWKNAVVYDD